MIHAYNLLGENIVLDAESGAVHILDDCAYATLTGADTSDFSQTEIDEIKAELDNLRQRGLLNAPKVGEQEAALGDDAEVIKAMCLLVSQDCNMRCRYCFAGEGDYGGERKYMSAETAYTAIDFLLANRGNRKRLEIDFFGGEPLINFDVVKEATLYAERRAFETGAEIRFTLTTNGLALTDEITDFLNAHMRNVVLSIDGRKEVNDALRKDIGGRGVYDRIAPNFERFAQRRGESAKRGGFFEFFVRGTYTKGNMDFSKDVRHLADLGFKNISIEPAVGTEFGFTQDDLPAIEAEYENLAATMADNNAGFSFFHFNIDLKGGPCAKKRLMGCGAGTEYIAVAANGDIYPCHRFTGKPTFRMGDVYGGITNASLRTVFEKCVINNKSDCEECFAKYYCGGGCAANAFEANGDIMKPDKIGCAMERKRVECAIALYAKRICKESKTL